MTLNMTIPKTQNPGAADSLTQQGGGEGEESITQKPRRGGLFNPTGGRGGGGLFNLFFAPPYVKLMSRL